MTKHCQECGQEFTRKRDYTGKLASITKFKRQKYCSVQCYRKSIRSWHNNHHLSLPEMWEPWEIRKVLE